MCIVISQCLHNKLVFSRLQYCQNLMEEGNAHVSVSTLIQKPPIPSYMMLSLVPQRKRKITPPDHREGLTQRWGPLQMNKINRGPETLNTNLLKP